MRRLAGCGLGEGKPGLDLGRRMITRLREVLHQDGRRANLDGCADGMPAASPDATSAFTLDEVPGRPGTDPGDVPGPLVAGLTPWSPALPARQQLRAAGALHGAADGGTAAVFLADEADRAPDAVADLLHHAYVDSPQFKFDSADLEPGSKVDITFPVAGTFQVLCAIHPKMKLAVRVK